ncbi:MAG: hypothetical protein ACP5M0_02630 [Desulfomonilaceae bacterium]
MEQDIAIPGPRIWVHRATFSYRLTRPAREWESLWVQRRGWGLLKRKDLWVATTLSESELAAQGYACIDPQPIEGMRACPNCGAVIIDVPGSLAQKHLQQCNAFTEEGRKLDEFMLDEQRLKIAEEKLRREQRQKQLEQEAELKRERAERIREETAARQAERDRKRRLKEEAKDQFMRS